MIAFANDKNQCIKLSSQNYQFPDLDDDTDEYDANWLLVDIEVIDNLQNWKTTDAFLLSSDWLSIAQWFSDVAQFKALKQNALGFIEPNLTFQLVKYNKADKTIDFDIELSLECVPPFCKNKSEAKYSFCFTQNECKKISEMCREEYKKFPERNVKRK